MGIKHSGKSTIGKKLAKKLRRGFYDLDTLIEDLEGGKPVREIYRSLGREGFQALESTAAAALASKIKNGETCVCALGGGTIENNAAIKELTEWALMVFLDEDPDILFQRIIKKGLPPFLDAKNPRDSFNELFEHRTRLYGQLADITILLQGKNIDEALQTVIHGLEVYLHEW
jgi:shikimate kinase